MQMTIGGVSVDPYIQSYSETIEKVYDTTNAFIAADGTEHKKCQGTRKKLSVTLGNVPANIKNQLKVKSSLSQITVSALGVSSLCTLDSFSAVSIIQTDSLNLWTVSFTISPIAISTEGSGTACDYSVTHLGTEYTLADGKLLDDIRISVNAGGAPVSGICATQLTFKINTLKVGFRPYIQACGECTVNGVNAPTFYVSGRSFENGIYTVTATDRTLFLDAPFDYTTLTDLVDDKNTVPLSNVVSEIARQCGFSSGGSTGGILDRIPVADLQTTCRSILEAISVISCGIFCCSSGNSLNFIRYGSYQSSIVLSDSKCTDISVGMEKGPIAGVQLTNNSTTSGGSEIFAQGSVGDSLTTILITSKYATAAIAASLYNSLQDKSYTAFSIAHAIVSDYVAVCTQIGFTDSTETFIAGEATTILSLSGIYAVLGASVNVETVWDFNGELTRKVNAQIEEGRKYHGVSINSKDGFTCEGTAGKITMADGSITFYSNSTPIVNEG
ncbi:MAG: hypothetical protein ACI4KF_12240 [Huintestinicola sp.]